MSQKVTALMPHFYVSLNCAVDLDLSAVSRVQNITSVSEEKEGGVSEGGHEFHAVPVA